MQLLLEFLLVFLPQAITKKFPLSFKENYTLLKIHKYFKTSFTNEKAVCIARREASSAS
jgi:hypothetical protein